MMIKVVSLLLYLCLAPFAGALLDGVDRKITARMQGRKGPKLLQPFYDLIKLFSKQMIAVNAAHRGRLLSLHRFIPRGRHHRQPDQRHLAHARPVHRLHPDHGHQAAQVPV